MCRCKCNFRNLVVCKWWNLWFSVSHIYTVLAIGHFCQPHVVDRSVTTIALYVPPGLYGTSNPYTFIICKCRSTMLNDLILRGHALDSWHVAHPLPLLSMDQWLCLERHGHFVVTNALRCVVHACQSWPSTLARKGLWSSFQVPIFVL
jgi:hypothetical protein